MPASAPNRIEKVASLAETLSAKELAEAWRVVAEHVGERLSESDVLDLAARTAASHPALRGKVQALRSLLAVAAGWQEIVERMAGAPRRIFDPDRLADSALKQARIAGEAVATIWDEELLTSSEAARRLGASPANREKINVRRRQSRLLGLPRDGGRRYLFPAFQIDATRQEIYPEVEKINRLLDAANDPWGVASWWLAANGRLGTRPVDLVGTERAAELVPAARALLEPLG